MSQRNPRVTTPPGRPPERPRRPPSRYPTSQPRVRARYGPPAPGARPASEPPASGNPMATWRPRGLRWGGLGLAVTLVAAGVLAACSSSAAGQIDYVVDGSLATYNTNTVVGAASAGAQAFARALTGFGYHRPDGQGGADHDFGTVSV